MPDKLNDDDRFVQSFDPKGKNNSTHEFHFNGNSDVAAMLDEENGVFVLGWMLHDRLKVHMSWKSNDDSQIRQREQWIIRYLTGWSWIGVTNSTIFDSFLHAMTLI